MKHLKVCPCGSAGMPDLTTVGAESKVSKYRILSPRQWYWFGVAAVALVFVAETVLTWRKWTDLPGDMGMELYMPWRLSQGAVLYRDLFTFAGGPFSQYFDALLFKIFGASFLTLALSNLAATAVLVLVMFRRFSAAADTWTAVTICLATIVVFAFGYYAYEGLNYVMPYSNEAVHGLVLSVLAVGFLSDWISRNHLRCAVLAGFCSGLVFLTKPDIFLALAACDAAAFGLVFFLLRKTEFAVKSLGAFFGAGMIPLLFFFFYFLRVENWHDSLRAVVFAWVPVFNSGVLKTVYYKWCTGLDRPGFYLENIVFQFGLVAVVTAFYAAAFGKIKRQEQDWTAIQRRAVPALAPVLLILIYAGHWRASGQAFSSSFASMLACLWLLLGIGIFILSTAASHWIPNLYRAPWAIALMLIAPLLTAAYAADWVDCGYALPLVALVSCALIYCNRDRLAGQDKFVFPFLWTVFGTVLLSKLGLFSRISGYGFVLAMPAFVAGVYCLFCLLPVVLEQKWQVPAFLFRSTVWLVLLAGFISLFRESERGYAMQNIPVGAGENRMLASELLDHANEFNSAIGWVQRNVPKNATLAAIPEGVTINFLTGRLNPTPCIVWDHNLLAVFGEAKMNAAFEKCPPDYVLIVDRNFGPIDPTSFGSPDYDPEVMQWIQQNYRTQFLIGHEPLKRKGWFGIKILKYSPGPSAVGGQMESVSDRQAQDISSR